MTTQATQCELCGADISRPAQRCTNQRCTECHERWCGPGGDTSPGHDRRYPPDVAGFIQFLKDHAEANDMEYRGGYSGRSMGGEECVGIVGTPEQHYEFTRQLFRSPYSAMESPRFDSMGKDTIAYWPRVKEEGA